MYYYILLFISLLLFPYQVQWLNLSDIELSILWCAWSAGLTSIFAILTPYAHSHAQHPSFPTYSLLKPYFTWLQKLRFPVKLCLYQPQENIINLLTQQGYDIINQNPRLGIWWQHHKHKHRMLTISTQQLQSVDHSLLFKAPFQQCLWLCSPNDLKSLKPQLNKFAYCLPVKALDLYLTDYPLHTTHIQVNHHNNIEETLSNLLVSPHPFADCLLKYFNIQETQKIIFKDLQKLLSGNANVFNNIVLNPVHMNFSPCQVLQANYGMMPNTLKSHEKTKGNLFPPLPQRSYNHWAFITISLMICTGLFYQNHLTRPLWMVRSFTQPTQLMAHVDVQPTVATTSPLSSNTNDITSTPPTHINVNSTPHIPNENAIDQIDNQGSSHTHSPNHQLDFVDDIKTILAKIAQSSQRQKTSLDIIHQANNHALFTQQPLDQEEAQLQKKTLQLLVTQAEPLLQQRYQIVEHYFKRHLSQCYPFAPDADVDCDIEHLTHFFKQSGILFQFVTQDLNGIIEYQNNHWQLTPWAHNIGLSSPLLNTIKQANLIQDLLFDLNKEALDIHFHLIKSHRPYALNIMARKKWMLSSSEQHYQVHWPQDFMGNWQIQSKEHAQKLNGPWALFHLVEQYQENQENNNIILNIMNTGPLTLTSNRPVHPMTMKLYQTFKAPNQAIKLDPTST